MGGNLLVSLIKQAGVYRRSLFFFVLIALLLYGGIAYRGNKLSAEPPPGNSDVMALSLNEDGNLYSSNRKVPAEIFPGESTYRFRYQVLNGAKTAIDELVVTVALPKPGTEETVGHRLISSGLTDSTTSELTEPQLITYTALGVGIGAQLAIELEVPKAFVTRSATLVVREKLAALPPVIWAVTSIALPALAFLLLLLVAIGRVRRVEPLKEQLNSLPTRLPPAMLGILLRGRLSSRDLAATFINLAERGHIVIRQLTREDYRFRRQAGKDNLLDFEATLLDQIFGPEGERASSEEVTFSLAQEVFSKRVSESFILAYKKMNDLGYFYTNPLKLHRRYQVAGLILFLLGLIGFLANILFFDDVRYSLLFWLAMMASSLLVFFFSKGLPMRTVYGDRELARWLSFRRYLVSHELVNFAAQSQEQYLSYLPYAIVLEVEADWTRRFYDLPFAQPAWYVASNISTIDQFANSVFPLFGYLSHALSLSSQPISR